MLLYQLAQWMDERTHLQHVLREDIGADRNLLQTQIEELEHQLYGQAERWRNTIHPLPYVSMRFEVPI